MNDVNPYAAPASELSQRPWVAGSIWHEGDVIVMTKDAGFPDRCVKCNEPTTWKLKRSLVWHSPFWYILVISPIIYLIAYLIVRKTAKIYVPLCPKHRSRRRWSIAIGWLVSLFGFFVLPITVAVNSAIPSEAIVAVGIGTIVAGIIGGVVGSRIVTATKIDKQLVWLKGAGQDFLAALPTSPG